MHERGYVLNYHDPVTSANLSLDNLKMQESVAQYKLVLLRRWGSRWNDSRYMNLTCK